MCDCLGVMVNEELWQKPHTMPVLADRANKGSTQI